MNGDDLVRIVTDALRDVDQTIPVRVEDNRYDIRRRRGDTGALLQDEPPAYHVLVSINGVVLPGSPWVSVTHTERYGFTPGGVSAYTYLEPPTGIREDTKAVTEWLAPLLQDAVRDHAPAAARAKTEDEAEDAARAVPLADRVVEASDVIREIR